MNLKGKIIAVLDTVTGTSAKGEWKKQSFVIETKDEYPKKVCIMTFKDLPIVLGNEVDVSINIESREYNGKYYTDVSAWKIDVLNSDTVHEEIPPGGEDETDLPFN